MDLDDIIASVTDSVESDVEPDDEPDLTPPPTDADAHAGHQIYLQWLMTTMEDRPSHQDLLTGILDNARHLDQTMSQKRSPLLQTFSSLCKLLTSFVI